MVWGLCLTVLPGLYLRGCLCTSAFKVCVLQKVFEFSPQNEVIALKLLRLLYVLNRCRAHCNVLCCVLRRRVTSKSAQQIIRFFLYLSIVSLVVIYLAHAHTPIYIHVYYTEIQAMVLLISRNLFMHTIFVLFVQDAFTAYARWTMVLHQTRVYQHSWYPWFIIIIFVW